jgi:predicted nicotinamide N-methyase
MRDFIQTNLPIVPVPYVPEIRLHRAAPRSGLWRLADRTGSGSPYWAYHWGGGLALARYFLDHPETVTGRVVLDLGTGSGIVAIAAAKAGAAKVIAADIDPLAIIALGLNAGVNGVAVSTLVADLTAGAPPPVDVVAVGDLFYEPDLAARVTAFLDRCLQQGIEVLVGDPRRMHLPLRRLRVLAEYPVKDFGEAGPAEAKPGAVFSFQPDGV